MSCTSTQEEEEKISNVLNSLLLLLAHFFMHKPEIAKSTKKYFKMSIQVSKAAA